ncbi:MAG TPA: DUF4160 domain-containing protein [Candidatus Kapabacteria bacterium]|nr:DUF4160 domain-containing protein [Candidatus Kapabacteria bacterium]HPO63678.1 DUF4160 domain-containing protein [Candidatus Kapabacteria bacterium]
MPQISRFFGIIISMFYDEHLPPHFHATYNEYNAEIKISDFSIIEGKLPARVLGLVVEWATIHKVEIEENWKRIENMETLKKIDPLV